MDLLHIGYAIAAHTFGSFDPVGADLCQTEFPTYYVISVIVMVLGYLSILRLVYLIFPHLLGYKYFNYQ